MIWTGSDYGLIHLISDGGKTWTDVTPPVVTSWTRINIIEASSHDAQTAYVAANRYEWTISNRISIVRTIREKLGRWSATESRKMLSCARCGKIAFVKIFCMLATETGVYVSFDDGDHWQSLQHNLPVVPVTDLTVKDNDLVISTQGRSFWILDDISPLQQLTAEVAATKVHLLKRATREPVWRRRAGKGAPRNWGRIRRVA